MTQIDRELPATGHLAELLARIRMVIVSIVALSIIALVVPINIESLRLSLTDPSYNTLTTSVINRLMSDLLPREVQLLPMDWFSPFTIYVYVAFFIGFTLSAPLLIYQIYKFLEPALYDWERKNTAIFVMSFTLLFVTGVGFGYFLIVPTTFRMLLGSTLLLGLTPSYEFSSFFSLVLGGLTVSGALFTFPVLFLLLVKAGILSTKQVSGARKLIYIGAFIVICLITPDPTILTDILIFIPIVIMLEVSMIIGKKLEKSRPS